MQRKKAVFNWSGGKDSALALYKVLQEKEYEVVSLLTTVNRDTQRSNMHAIPIPLLKKQTRSIGIPLYIVELTPNGNITDYENAMKNAVEHFTRSGIRHFIFGDIYLHDVKTYREKQLKPYGIKVVEPLWGKSSKEIMDDFLNSGLQAVVVTTMADILDETFIGRHINENFIHDLPDEADICGENGEYHTFCYNGEIFSSPVPFSLGKPSKISFPIKLDDGTEKEYPYWFADLNEQE